MKVWIGEAGEYENRYTAFAAVTPQAAVEYLKAEHPEGNWQYVVEVRPDTLRNGEVYVTGWTDHKITGSVHADPRRGNLNLVSVEYDLSEIDFAGPIDGR